MKLCTNTEEIRCKSHQRREAQLLWNKWTLDSLLFLHREHQHLLHNLLVSFNQSSEQNASAEDLHCLFQNDWITPYIRTLSVINEHLTCRLAKRTLLMKGFHQVVGFVALPAGRTNSSSSCRCCQHGGAICPGNFLSTQSRGNSLKFTQHIGFLSVENKTWFYIFFYYDDYFIFIYFNFHMLKKHSSFHRVLISRSDNHRCRKKPLNRKTPQWEKKVKYTQQNV